MPGNTDPPDRLEWEAPAPKITPRGSKWTPIAEALKSRPGQWACIGRNVQTGVVTAIRGGQLKCWQPKGAFEVTVRNHTSRWSGDVYVRYVGDNQEYV